MPDPIREDPEDRTPPRSYREDGRSRLLRALLKPTRGQVVVAVLLALVGFAAVTQVRTNTVDDTYAGLREQDLIDILNGLAGTTQRAQTELSRLEDTRADLQSDTEARRAALEQARDQADVLSILAGTVPVSGPGVRITIRERSGKAGLSAFLDMVQALRTGDAEAMAINSQVRVVAQTSFEEATGGLVVDGQLVEPPYTVDVIGSPEQLVGALRFPAGPQDQFADDGAELTWQELDRVQIEAVADLDDATSARASQ
jgi:uncharacterized protein YlxW (UPF0749 family)